MDLSEVSDLTALVRIHRDDTLPAQPGSPVQVIEGTVSPFNLLVFPLPAREVDGSPPGEFNTGTGTALTRNAYRITSTVPVVAYQFNPLENVNVFSNDASLLKPVEALRGQAGTMEDAYVGRDRRTGDPLYECSSCTNAFPAGDIDIDHIDGILSYVNANTDPVQWTVDLGNGWYRTAEAITLEDARDAV